MRYILDEPQLNAMLACYYCCCNLYINVANIWRLHIDVQCALCFRFDVVASLIIRVTRVLPCCLLYVVVLSFGDDDENELTWFLHEKRYDAKCLAVFLRSDVLNRFVCCCLRPANILQAHWGQVERGRQNEKGKQNREWQCRQENNNNNNKAHWDAEALRSWSAEKLKRWGAEALSKAKARRTKTSCSANAKVGTL